MEKAGMKPEGIWRAAGFNNTGVCDEVWHSIIKSDLDLQLTLQEEKIW